MTSIYSKYPPKTPVSHPGRASAQKEKRSFFATLTSGDKRVLGGERRQWDWPSPRWAPLQPCPTLRHSSSCHLGGEEGRRTVKSIWPQSTEKKKSNTEVSIAALSVMLRVKPQLFKRFFFTPAGKLNRESNVGNLSWSLFVKCAAKWGRHP